MGGGKGKEEEEEGGGGMGKVGGREQAGGGRRGEGYGRKGGGEGRSSDMNRCRRSFGSSVKPISGGRGSPNSPKKKQAKNRLKILLQ